MIKNTEERGIGNTSGKNGLENAFLGACTQKEFSGVCSYKDTDSIRLKFQYFYLI